MTEIGIKIFRNVLVSLACSWRTDSRVKREVSRKKNIFFSLSLSAAFVFLFAFYFAPHYPVAGQSIGGHKGGGGGRAKNKISLV